MKEGCLKCEVRNIELFKEILFSSLQVYIETSQSIGKNKYPGWKKKSYIFPSLKNTDLT